MNAILDHFKEEGYYLNGYMGAAGFAALMSFGAHARIMQGVSVGAGLLALYSAYKPQSVRSHPENDVLTGCVSASTAVHLCQKFALFRRVEKKKDFHFMSGAGAKNFYNMPIMPVGKPNITHNGIDAYDAIYYGMKNSLNIPKKLINTAVHIHEEIHAFWRNVTQFCFGKAATLRSVIYYGASQERAYHTVQGKISQFPSFMSFFHPGLECAVNVQTILNSALTGRTGYLGDVIRLTVKQSSKFTLYAAPLAFLMQQAAKGWKELTTREPSH